MTIRLLTLTSGLALCAGIAAAEGQMLNRIASFPVTANLPADADAGSSTSPEIIAASGDGLTLIYSDSPLGAVGFIDITDPAAPAALGAVTFPDGEPTSVAAQGGLAYAGVNTSPSFTAPAGHLAVIDIATRAIVATCDLGGQPDATAIAADGSFLAVAIENERDEDAGDGRVGQAPAGWVSIMPLQDGMPDCAAEIRVDLTGLTEIAPEDPEPEFVDINAAGEIAVTLQENNHIVVLDRTGTILSHFSAGSVDLEQVDLDDNGSYDFTQSQPARLREPDGIQWIGPDHFATANEGDMDGGSRGFTIWHRDGTVVYEAGNSLEHAIARIGHYPDKRSDAKGNEPEGIEFAVMEGVPTLFILSERASVVAAYDVTDPAAPVLRQILPSGISPEGAIAIPARGLIATANEADLREDGGAPAHVMIYQMQDGAAVYPQLTSEGAEGVIGWAALGALTHDEAGRLYAATDSFFKNQPAIFAIDATQTPARITERLLVTRDGAAASGMDIEGLASDGQGGFWLANEGDADKEVPHALIHVDATGAITQEIAFPEALLAHQTRFGAEGIALHDGKLWVAMQRPWGDDAENSVKLLAHDLASGEWGAVAYQTAAPVNGGWVGLSEIAIHGDHAYLIERDNQIGANAAIKLVTRVALSELVPAPLGGDLPVVTREVVRDLLPDLAAANGFVTDKPEGLTILEDGTAWLVTDNDGIDDSAGETLFFSFKVD